MAFLTLAGRSINFFLGDIKNKNILTIFMTNSIMNGYHHVAVILQYGILVTGFILREILKMALEREAGV